ncbi:MAG: preprotein translocase subunit SecY, partial [Peptococcaceae bacterium]|nr:preprotein translocase subunit SecY [Peptococcaceae bacterium]
MLGSFAGAFKASELRTKLLYTLGMIFIFRLGAHIPVPGVNPERFAELVASGVIFGFFDVISGGALKNFSVFAMSITPYINASIIMQLLTVVIPHLERLQKEGEEGRKKITQYTRYLTVILAFIQGLGMVVGVSGSLQNPGPATYLMTALTITAGTTFLMWLG